jgi:hypothetical protein
MSKIIVSRSKYFDSGIEVTLGELLEIVNAWISECGVDSELEIDCGYNSPQIIVNYKSEETDEEYSRRLELEESSRKAEANKVRKKIEQYEKLKDELTKEGLI